MKSFLEGELFLFHNSVVSNNGNGNNVNKREGYFQLKLKRYAMNETYDT